MLGLGNPGRRYEKTRHNVGFRVVERLAGTLGARFGRATSGDLAQLAPATCAGRAIVIAKPMTWMNHSGVAAAHLARLYGVEPADWIVTYDDVALPLGAVRVRAAGRSAGQKGMESVLQALGTDAVARVRLGILGPRSEEDLADYVLEPFLPGEKAIADAMIDRAAEAIQTVLNSGIERAMNLYNRREVDPD